MVARLLYGFRISVFFGLALTVVAAVIGILWDAHPGLLRRRVDLGCAARRSRSGTRSPSFTCSSSSRRSSSRRCSCCSVVFALFGWIWPVRLRARRVPAQPQPRVREGGARDGPVQRADHPAAPAAQLDDAGDHVPAVPHERRDPVPGLARLPRARRDHAASLGELLRQGKDNLDAWWISMPTFLLLVIDAAVADVHRRRAARRLRHAEVLMATIELGAPHELPPGGRQALRQLRPVARRRPRFVRRRRRREVRARRRIGLRQVGHGAFRPPADRDRDLRRRDPLRRRGPPEEERAADARHSRQRHRDDLPGADDGAQSALYDRQPDRRGARGARGPRQEPRARPRDRAPAPHRHPRSRRSASTPIRTSSPAASASAR